MIDLTPLDVRKKRGDFSSRFRGYDTHEVDTFLELVAERLETLVKENLTLRERSERLAEQVSQQGGREHAVQEALVTAHELREEIKDQARREADLVRREAEAEAERILADAQRLRRQEEAAIEELERRRIRFLKAVRTLLERELDFVAVEESRPLDEARPAGDDEEREGGPPEAGRDPRLLEVDLSRGARGRVEGRQSEEEEGGSRESGRAPGEDRTEDQGDRARGAEAKGEDPFHEAWIAPGEERERSAGEG